MLLGLRPAFPGRTTPRTRRVVAKRRDGEGSCHSLYPRASSQFTHVGTCHRGPWDRRSEKCSSNGVGCKGQTHREMLQTGLLRERLSPHSRGDANFSPSVWRLTASVTMDAHPFLFPAEALLSSCWTVPRFITCSGTRQPTRQSRAPGMAPKASMASSSLQSRLRHTRGVAWSMQIP